MSVVAETELDSTEPHARGSREWDEAFFSALEQTGVILKACEAAQVDRTTVWVRRKNDPEFKARFETSLKVGALLLETEAIRRARDGLQRKKFTRNGEPIMDPATGEQYVEHEYSDMLLLALLRRHMPDEYKDAKPGDINIQTNVAVMNTTELTDLQERRKRAELAAEPKQIEETT